MSGTLTLVATPIGNLSDMSQRAIDTLGSVTVVCCEDTRRTGLLLQHLGLSGKKYIVINEHTEHDACEHVVALLLDDIDVALVSDAGTPGISDPGERLVKAALNAGINVSAIPGPSALTMALVMSGLPTARFVFEGFLPRSGGDRTRLIDEVATEMRTVVLYEAPHRMKTTFQQLCDEGQGDRSVVCCRELTKLYEEFKRGSVQDILTWLGTFGDNEVTLICQS